MRIERGSPSVPHARKPPSTLETGKDSQRNECETISRDHQAEEKESPSDMRARRTDEQSGKHRKRKGAQGGAARQAGTTRGKKRASGRRGGSPPALRDQRTIAADRRRRRCRYRTDAGTGSLGDKGASLTHSGSKVRRQTRMPRRREASARKRLLDERARQRLPRFAFVLSQKVVDRFALHLWKLVLHFPGDVLQRLVGQPGTRLRIGVILR